MGAGRSGDDVGKARWGLSEKAHDPHIRSMNSNAFFDILNVASVVASGRGTGAGQATHQAGAWQVLPLDGRFEITYEDSRGIWSRRVLDARELRLGPGRTLLGGIDRARGGYRGFRVDRIRRLTEEGGTRIETGILDWLLARAEAQRRQRADLVRRLARRNRSGQRAA